MSTELEQLAPAAPSAASPARRAAVKGRRKAAVLLVSLGTERAAQVFKHLRDDEIEALSLEMAKLQRVDPGTSGQRARGARRHGHGLRLAERRRRRLRA